MTDALANPSTPSALYLLLKHLDVPSLKQAEAKELVEMVRHTPMDPNEEVIEASFRNRIVKKSLLDRALETMCPWGKTPVETENGIKLVHALLERGVSPSISLSKIASEKMRDNLPLTMGLIQHYQSPADRPSLPSELFLGVRLLGALAKGGSSKQCIEKMEGLVSTSSLQEIEGVHPAVWLALQSAPRHSEGEPNSGLEVRWGSGWKFDGSKSGGEAFFGRMAKALEGWATKDLNASDPQLLLLDACLAPWAGVSRGMKGRWFYSPESGAQAAEKAVDLARSLPSRVMDQAISSFLGTASALLKKSPSPTDEAIARVFIGEAVSLSLGESSCSRLIAGKALWGNQDSGEKTSSIMGQKEGGVREGLILWAGFLSERAVFPALPTAWLGTLMEAADKEGHDVLSQIKDVVPTLEPVMERAEEIKSDLPQRPSSPVSTSTRSQAAAMRAFERVEDMVLEARMGAALPASSRGRAPGARF